MIQCNQLLISTICKVKIIKSEFAAYKMKRTTTMGSILLVSFEDEIISIANIQAQLLVMITILYFHFFKDILTI